MNKEFEMQPLIYQISAVNLLRVQKLLEDLQKRNNCKAEINKIFEQILQANSALRQYFIEHGFSFDEFEPILKDYQQALLKEVDFLPIDYLQLKSNHPLRAAMALSNLNAPQSLNTFLFNLQNFTKEANDSHFYPRAKAMAIAVIVGLTLLAICATVVFFRFPLSLGQKMFGAFGATFSLLAADDLYSSAKNSFKPIFAAKDAGNCVSKFFSNPKPQISIDKAQKVPHVDETNADSAAYQGTAVEAMANAASDRDLPPVYQLYPVI